MIVFHSYVNVYQRVFQLQAEVSLQLHLKKLSQCWKPGGTVDLTPFQILIGKLQMVNFASSCPI